MSSRAPALPRLHQTAVCACSTLCCNEQLLACSLCAAVNSRAPGMLWRRPGSVLLRVTRAHLPPVASPPRVFFAPQFQTSLAGFEDAGAQPMQGQLFRVFCESAGLVHQTNKLPKVERQSWVCVSAQNLLPACIGSACACCFRNDPSRMDCAAAQARNGPRGKLANAHTHGQARQWCEAAPHCQLLILDAALTKAPQSTHQLPYPPAVCRQVGLRPRDQRLR